MRDKESLHKRVQEEIDCFLTTDPLAEMAELATGKDFEEAALKWLALVTLHGINMNAEKITLEQTDDDKVTVTAEYRPTELPSPGPEIGKKIIESVREITHLEKDKDKMTLALGIRNSGIDLQVSVKRKEDKEKIKLKFPPISAVRTE
ncbi:MAG: hypothetical protein R6U50_14365 [Desulfobacterales bacterium]